jgi:hypothetical protein
MRKIELDLSKDYAPAQRKIFGIGRLMSKELAALNR